MEGEGTVGCEHVWENRYQGWFCIVCQRFQDELPRQTEITAGKDDFDALNAAWQITERSHARTLHHLAFAEAARVHSSHGGSIFEKCHYPICIVNRGALSFYAGPRPDYSRAYVDAMARFHVQMVVESNAAHGNAHVASMERLSEAWEDVQDASKQAQALIKVTQ